MSEPLTEHLPDEIQYGFVYGKTLLAVGDTTNDPDRFPDGVAAKGVVRFTPKTTILRTEVDPATIIKQRIECKIHQGKDEANDPDPAKTGLLIDTAGHVGNVALIVGQYDVSYQLEGGASVPSFTIEVTADNTAEEPLVLAKVAPIQPSPAVKFVVNEQVYEDTIAARDDVLGAIPAGGDTGQVLAKVSGADLDTVWVDPAGGGGAVDSVNGQTGAVVLGAGDVGAAPTVHGHAIGDVDGLQDELDGKQPAGDYLTEGDLPAPPDLSPYAKTADLASVATSGSYDDLGDKPDIPSTPGDVGARPAGDVPWGEVADKPATFPPSSHSHPISDVTGLQSALDGKQPTGDYLTGGDLPDLSGYVESSDPRLTDARTPLAHTHSIGDVTGLQTALDDLDDAIGDVGAVLDAILEGTP